MAATTRRNRRAGNVLILALFLMVAMLACVAFSVDLGYLYVTRAQLQRSADSAALAAAWELVDDDALAGYTNSSALDTSARSRASQYAALNLVLNGSPALADEDITTGYIADPSDPLSPQLLGSGYTLNSVRVRVRRTADQNGEAPLFFARALGIESQALQAEATAALLTAIGGFRTPSDGSNLEILPFALDEDTWNGMLAGAGTDNWTWNSATQEIESYPDGILEINLYPQGTGSPGNRGTVDIGSSNNSTADIARQILDGVSPQDMEHHGGSLEFDAYGELELNGDTGISAGVKDELASIMGEPRIIPIFTTVVGPGNNAQYTIVKFVGVRIMDVKLTGSMSSKRVIIQPANIVAKGGVPAPPNSEPSQFIYSPVWLVR
jgi:hypothetical protein